MYDMSFFKEFNGFIFEFNSVGEYLEFLAGRVMAIIVIIGIILLVIWFL